MEIILNYFTIELHMTQVLLRLIEVSSFLTNHIRFFIRLFDSGCTQI